MFNFIVYSFSTALDHYFNLTNEVTIIHVCKGKEYCNHDGKGVLEKNSRTQDGDG